MSSHELPHCVIISVWPYIQEGDNNDDMMWFTAINQWFIDKFFCFTFQGQNVKFKWEKIRFALSKYL
jgi:hypothetical protein